MKSELENIIKRMKKLHSYGEVTFDIYSLEGF